MVEVVPDIKKAEGLLLENFKSRRFDVIVTSNKYHSVCRDIDGRGWMVDFTITQTGETNAPIAVARFFNPLHREGRFVSCEDFADASKSKPNLPELFSIPVDMGGWNVQMIGSGVCQLEKPFFLFDVMIFKSSDPTETEPDHVYEIELEYERPRSAEMNIAVSAVKDAESYLAEYFYFLGESFERKNGTHISHSQGACS